MAARCASRYGCSHSVEQPGYWCPECQERGANGGVTDVVALSMVGNLSPRWQLKLLGSSQELVRIQVARRRDLHIEVRKRALEDDNLMIVCLAAEGSKDPLALYQVFRRARQILTGEDQAEIEGANNLLRVLAGNPFLPLRGLRQLADHPDPSIRDRATRTFWAVYERARVAS